MMLILIIAAGILLACGIIGVVRIIVPVILFALLAAWLIGRVLEHPLPAIALAVLIAASFIAKHFKLDQP